MNNPLNDLFATNADFQSFCSLPGTDIRDLYTEAFKAKKKITNIIGIKLYEMIVASNNTEECNALRIAMANLCLHSYFPAYVIGRRKNDQTDIYKHEQEKIMRGFMETQADAMDTLLSITETNDTYKSEFDKLPFAKLRALLLVKSAIEMDLFYPINCSHLFFLRSVPIQKELMESMYEDLIRRIGERTDLNERLKRAMVKHIIAFCIKRLDITELPVTIRNLFDDSKVVRYSSQENQMVDKLAAELIGDAMNIIDTITKVLDVDESSSVDVSSSTADNKETDKYFLIS